MIEKQKLIQERYKMRKKIITVLMACMAATAIFGCGDGKEQGDMTQRIMLR